MNKEEELKQRMLKLAFYRHPEDEDVIYLRLGVLCESVAEYAQQEGRDEAIKFALFATEEFIKGTYQTYTELWDEFKEQEEQ